MRASDSRGPTLVQASLLGLAQIIIWGGSFFLIAVIAQPVAIATGWPLQWIFGALSIGLAVSGLLSPLAARRIVRNGGRAVLIASVPVMAGGLLISSIATTLPVFIAGWIVIGAGMAAGLYDPLFAALGQIYGDKARGAITHVTLISGFATTLCWPATELAIQHIGWRAACATYAVVMMPAVILIYWIAIPAAAIDTNDANAALSKTSECKHDPYAHWVLTLLIAGFTLASIIMTAISVHLLALLTGSGLSEQTAITLGACLGPAQVGARALEFMAGRRTHPIWSALASAILVAAGLGLVFLFQGTITAGLILYGAGSGLRSIVRGTLPLSIFGKQLYAQKVGLIARWSFVAQAVTPFAGGLALKWLGTAATLQILCGLAIVNVLLVLALMLGLRRGTA